jgi:hypothetical protein
VDWISSIESNNHGQSLGTGPEWISIAILGIGWEQSQKISDGMVIVGIKDVPCLLDAELQTLVLEQSEQLLSILELVQDLKWSLRFL